MKLKVQNVIQLALFGSLFVIVRSSGISGLNGGSTILENVKEGALKPGNSSISNNSSIILGTLTKREEANGRSMGKGKWNAQKRSTTRHRPLPLTASSREMAVERNQNPNGAQQTSQEILDANTADDFTTNERNGNNGEDLEGEGEEGVDRIGHMGMGGLGLSSSHPDLLSRQGGGPVGTVGQTGNAAIGGVTGTANTALGGYPYPYGPYYPQQYYYPFNYPGWTPYPPTSASAAASGFGASAGWGGSSGYKVLCMYCTIST